MKLKELVERNEIMTQDEVKDFYEKMSTTEKEYSKKEYEVNFKIADKTERVETIIDGEKETTNTANKGDYIITGSMGEKYVLTPKKFNHIYEKIREGKAKTKPVKIKAKVLGFPIKFKADWGEVMTANKGDFLVNNNGEIYRIEKRAFGKTYK